MNRKRIILLVAMSIAVSLCLWQSWLAFVVQVTPPHQGDGEFRDISRRAGPFAINGYEISMPKFSLDQAFQAEYHVSGLTRLHAKCGIYLGVNDNRFAGSAMGGRLHLTATDKSGKIVVDANGRLEDFYCWSTGQEHGFYRLNDSFFIPSPNETYRIRIDYVPSPSLNEYQGYIRIRCGGTL